MITSDVSYIPTSKCRLESVNENAENVGSVVIEPILLNDSLSLDIPKSLHIRVGPKHAEIAFLLQARRRRDIQMEKMK